MGVVDLDTKNHREASPKEDKRGPQRDEEDEEDEATESTPPWAEGDEIPVS